MNFFRSIFSYIGLVGNTNLVCTTFLSQTYNIKCYFICTSNYLVHTTNYLVSTTYYLIVQHNNLERKTYYLVQFTYSLLE